MKRFVAAVLNSLILVGCGGGGSNDSASASSTGETVSSSTFTGATDPSSSSSVPPVAARLAKYEGVWRKDCENHMRVTKTSTATGATTFSAVTKEEYFDNADCTGALVATGSYGVADESVEYLATLQNASVTLGTSETISSAEVDPAISILAKAQFTFTGSGVIPMDSPFADATLTGIKYANGEQVVLLRYALGGQTTQGAFLLRNDELLALVPVGDSTTSFKVKHRYIR